MTPELSAKCPRCHRVIAKLWRGPDGYVITYLDTRDDHGLARVGDDLLWHGEPETLKSDCSRGGNHRVHFSEMCIRNMDPGQARTTLRAPVLKPMRGGEPNPSWPGRYPTGP